MPEWVSTGITGAFGLAALMALSVAIPQLLLVPRLVWRHDPILPYTISTVLWTSAVGLACFWRFLVFIDLSYFDQEYMGTIDSRWPIEVLLAGYLVGAVGYATVLYHIRVTYPNVKRWHASRQRVDPEGCKHGAG